MISLFRLEKMKKEYRDLSTWREKATYLEGILNPKLERSQPKVINIIHSPIHGFKYFLFKKDYSN